MLRLRPFTTARPVLRSAGWLHDRAHLVTWRSTPSHMHTVSREELDRHVTAAWATRVRDASVPWNLGREKTPKKHQSLDDRLRKRRDDNKVVLAAPTKQPAPAADDPTFIPRPQGIRDGPWTDLDVEAVQRAQRNAARLARETARHSPGTVLLARPLTELEDLVLELGEPKYRARQLQSAVLSGVRSVDSITKLPLKFREALKSAGVRTGRSNVHALRQSSDGTAKLLLQLADGRVVETVGIPSRDGRRLTACVSSQVGCPMRCTFCATGKGGFARNLLPHEIVDQVLSVGEHFSSSGIEGDAKGGPSVANKLPTHVVFMGMGEPLLNLPSVLEALRVLREDLGIGARHVTLSTVGVPGALRQLAAHRLQTTLAVSLHAPNQHLREQIVPSAKAYPVEALVADCERYFMATKRRISFEYTLLGGVNDSPKHAEQLADLLWQHPDMRAHVNLIPWNAVDDTEFETSQPQAVDEFCRVLEKRSIPATIRISRGLEAAAACGQLRNMYQKQPLEAFAVPA